MDQTTVLKYRYWMVSTDRRSHGQALCVLINPELEFVGDEMMELMDDCMPFPNLLVRVRRYRHCILRCLDENWEMRMDDDMSELILHEYDYLDGSFATMRASDNKSFVVKK